jgi:hypothetical protein
MTVLTEKIKGRFGEYTQVGVLDKMRVVVFTPAHCRAIAALLKVEPNGHGESAKFVTQVLAQAKNE